MKRNYNIDESNVGNQSMHHQQQMLINNMNNPNNYGDMIQQNVQGEFTVLAIFLEKS